MKTIVKCKCGYRIRARDILRTDLYARVIAPNYIWLKYRCSRCKSMGETFVAEDSFDSALLHKDRRELSEPEREKFAEVEAISADELLEFRALLAHTDSIVPGTFADPE